MMSDRFRWGLGDAWDWYLGYYRRMTLVFVVVAVVVLTCTFLAGRATASTPAPVPSRSWTRPVSPAVCVCWQTMELGPCAPKYEQCECPDGSAYWIQATYDERNDVCVLERFDWPAEE